MLQFLPTVHWTRRPNCSQILTWGYTHQVGANLSGVLRPDRHDDQADGAYQERNVVKHADAKRLKQQQKLGRACSGLLDAEICFLSIGGTKASPRAYYFRQIIDFGSSLCMFAKVRSEGVFALFSWHV